MARSEASGKVLATNRKAFFRYEVLERAEAGLALAGTEVKSIRDGGLSFADSWVEFRGGEMFLIGCRIAPYSHGNLMNHLPERDRKLLLHKREIQRLGGRASERGLTLVPLRVYLKDGRVKMEIGLGRGKQMHDKREAIRRRDEERDARRAIRGRRD
ncbi:MAG TPA: SsrA-binding protein SmpB [Vicinamibacteria bacterium]|nr:SsrA-binding protein SmpB [Vicinamibacteria bacterium]